MFCVSFLNMHVQLSSKSKPPSIIIHFREHPMILLDCMEAMTFEQKAWIGSLVYKQRANSWFSMERMTRNSSSGLCIHCSSSKWYSYRICVYCHSLSMHSQLYNSYTMGCPPVR